jgi:3-hydroxybutyryl-CoA dehydrogenase
VWRNFKKGVEENMKVEKVGVIGCGIMGSGIAQVCAQSGYQVIVSEISDELLKKGLQSIDSFLTRSVSKGKLSSEEKEAVLSRIRGTTNIKDFPDCDLTIEAAPEALEIKKDIFRQLDQVCPGHAILASNTSVLSVTDLAAVTKRPDKVLGMHFANPVPLMRSLEMVRTIATSDETVETAKAVGERLKKKVIVVKDQAGFVANRMLAPFLLNAIRMVEAGVPKEDIDALITEGLGHPMGPLTLLDLIGIDTVFYGAIAIFDELKDPQYNPPTLMRKMVAMGWHGRKTGKGFYEYKDTGRS